jgi:large subunit ribosomal protein L9
MQIKMIIERWHMKVYLIKDVERVGLAGEILNVAEGYGANFLLPRKLAVQITPSNEAFYKGRIKSVEHRKEVIESATSMLAEKIKSIELTIKRKIHDGDKLFGSISPSDIVELLAKENVKVAKNQIDFGKSIKAKGSYEVTVKLSSKLQPKFKLTVKPE